MIAYAERVFSSIVKNVSKPKPVVISQHAPKNCSQHITVETKPYAIHKLKTPPSKSAKVTKEEALRYYKKMVAIRQLEQVSSTMYKAKEIRGFCHLYSGQEAVAVGMHEAMNEHDAIITSYRAHGWTYLMGATATQILAELTGRETGISRGKGGSMHMYAKNFYGGNGIVGGQVPLGAGIALALKYRKIPGVCFALYGDGAANQGQIFEAYNIAALWKLPCVFVCENNQYGMGTSTERAAASTEYYKRGDYVPGIRMDGQDALTVREASKYAKEHCLADKGPIVLEAVTYRYFGHSMSDPGTSYRTRDEVTQVRKTRDPIATFRKLMVDNKFATEDEVKKIDAEVKKEMSDASKASTTDKVVSINELTADIYARNYEASIRNILPWNGLKHANVGKPSNLL